MPLTSLHAVYCVYIHLNIHGWFDNYNSHKVQIVLSIIFEIHIKHACSALPMQGQFMTKSLHQAMLLAVLHSILDVAP